MTDLLLITVDCLRPDVLGCHGGGARTPCLDAVAQEGIRYEYAFAHGSFTKTTFPTIFGSSYPSEFGGSRRFAAERPSLVTHLRRCGYHTLGVNSNPWLSAQFGFERGYERYVDLSTSTPVAHSAPVRIINNLLGLFEAGLIYPPYPSATQITDAALSLLEEARSPYFLWVHYMDAHWPYAVSEPQLYGPWNRQKRAYNARLARKSRRVPKTVTKEENDALYALYRQGVEVVDTHVGTLLEAVGENTAIAITADHGEAFGEHDTYFHVAGVYRENVNIPLLMRAPAVRPGSVESSVVRHIDLAPTLAALVDCEPDPKFRGHNLLPAATGSKVLPALPAYSEARRNKKWWLSLRQDPYAVLLLLDQATGQIEQRMLYNYRLDPTEQHDLSHEPGPLSTQMETELLTFAAAHGNPLASGPEEALDSNDSDLHERLKALGYLE